MTSRAQVQVPPDPGDFFWSFWVRSSPSSLSACQDETVSQAARGQCAMLSHKYQVNAASDAVAAEAHKVLPGGQYCRVYECKFLSILPSPVKSLSAVVVARHNRQAGGLRNSSRITWQMLANCGPTPPRALHTSASSVQQHQAFQFCLLTYVVCCHHDGWYEHYDTMGLRAACAQQLTSDGQSLTVQCWVL